MFTPRRITYSVLGLCVGLATLFGVAAAGMSTLMRTPALPVADPQHPWPEPVPSSDGPIVVAVALGQSGTVASDALAPYEVFASSPRFQVYTIAQTRGATHLAGGPAALPVHTFGDADRGTAPEPDIIVIPAVGDPAGPQEAQLRRWARRQADRGAHVLGVCAGSRVLGAAGLLDGRQATSHWDTITRQEADYPQTDWIRGRRYVQDGPVTTTAGVTSGIPAALKLVQDFAGETEARRVADLVDYPGWTPDSTTIPGHRFTLSDVPMMLARGLPWFRPTYAVALADGMSELDIAAAFEVYDVSAAARTLAVTPDDGAITTRHGLVLLPTPQSAATTTPTRLLVPGAAHPDQVAPAMRHWAAAHEAEVTPLSSAGNGHFDAALEDLARHADRNIAASSAKRLDYPTEHLTLAGNGWQWRPPALFGLSLLLATVVGSLPAIGRRAVRVGRAR
ncbi:DJ-1/PfpI family protein [Ornithinicoccus halotolerans]|uniref:DJ-1/PfpI family protein n=1 Tax=Ornithinicoccus halotolerans TaxID=1748220 RepID=UPI001296E069|nr:DJ-1/PfpI family protein [Ornithinicoccus halotolerans]